MEVDDGYIPGEVFEECLERFPQVCVELVLQTDDGVLLCNRAVKPKLWFWPGSRLYKGEELKAAALRVAREELGISVDIAERLGVHPHFWQPEQVDESISRHTVNVVFRATPARSDYEIDLDEQHTAYRLIAEPDPRFHQYVNEYLNTYNLVET